MTVNPLRDTKIPTTDLTYNYTYINKARDELCSGRHDVHVI